MKNRKAVPGVRNNPESGRRIDLFGNPFQQQGFPRLSWKILHGLWVFDDFNPYNLLAGLIFGLIGWVSFSYGRKMDLWQPCAIGMVLMAYPYFVYNPWLLWGIGIGLIVLLWFYHDE